MSLRKLIGLALALGSRRHQRMQSADKGSEMYEQLRATALSKTAEELGLDASKPAFGALMEIDVNGRKATLTSFATGDASLYFGNGGGVIGGITNPEAASAAKDFVETAGALLPMMEKATSFPKPAPEEIFFYVLTPDGVYTARAEEAALKRRDGELSKLFYSGHEVITALRQMSGG